MRTLLCLLAAVTSVANAQTYDTLLFRALTWRDIGPYRGGRSVAVAGSASRPYEYWMGTTGGGVLKTTDGGIHWSPATDKYFGGTIGAIGVSESNPDIVYVGTGEYDIRGNVSHGDGVYKTTDGGKTWTKVGLTDTRQISRVRVDPHDPNIVYVGALGHVWGPNPERGLYKSTDGGKTWNKILFRNDSTGICEVVIDANDSRTIYAAFWQAGRKPWQLVSGGAGSGIFKSTDAGATWTEITRNSGLPTGIIGNIGLAVSPANSQRVWALVEADSGGVYRSDDGGQTWTKTNSERKLRQRAWYYTKIFADPKDANTIYALNTNFYKSVDGGKTFKNIPVPHGDNHDLWIASNDPQRMIESNDGSGNISFNGGKSWSEQDDATAQFYHVTTTMDFPYKVCGAQQDNTTLCGPSANAGGIVMADWQEVGGGESGYIQVRPDSTDLVYAGSYSYLSKKNLKTGFQKEITPWPENPMGHSAGDLKYRFQWTFPILISPHDPKTLYVGANVLFKSTDDGQNWQTISPDLTRHDPATLGASGGPITKDQTSVEYYATIFAVAESPITRGELWTGSDDGKIYLTRTGGAPWTDVSPKDWGEWMRISSLEPSHYDAGTIYVAGNRYQLDDMKPYLLKSTDYGKTWKLITNGIPDDEFTRVIREDPVKRGLLYAGTERGVYVSFDDGAHWQSLRRNLPLVPIHDLVVKGNDLVAATHGRSFWILTDLSPLRQFASGMTATQMHLFKPAIAYRVSWGGFGGGGDGDAAPHPAGKNPPSGAVIYYTLADSTSAVTMDILDSAGRTVRKLSSRLDSASLADSIETADSVKAVRRDSLTKAGVSADSINKLLAHPDTTKASNDGENFKVPPPPRIPAKMGLNMFAWNMRYPDASAFDNLIMWAGGVAGPVAPPGRYTVKLTVGNETQSQPLIIRADPRSTATPAQLTAQFALLMKIRDRLSAANDAVKTIRNVAYQIHTDSADAPTGFVDAASPFVARLHTIEAELYQVKNRSGQDPLNFPIRLNNEIAALAGTVASADGRPTAPTYAVFQTLSVELDKQLASLKTVIATDLPKLNVILKNAGRPEIVPRPEEPPRQKKPTITAMQ
ncbi:MAG TPA: glycosyl hydrolase [Gemmatimonadaceae bacterium]|nr:glycosyl hydrolase [Gemmatimonadaceae bacterium]